MKIFADVGNLRQVEEFAGDPSIDGFTTNPTLMRTSGVTDYKQFARDVLSIVKDRPVSFEVSVDTYSEMMLQAHRLAALGTNVYVKIPITDRVGMPLTYAIRNLSNDKVKVNVTAVMTDVQTLAACAALDTGTSGIVSIFAGRIADTGVDPLPILQSAIFSARLHTEILWASSRELLNIQQAQHVGCHIITLLPGLLHKRYLIGKPLDQYSLETIQQFYKDAEGYDI